ncbi:MAG: GNAT family N-acetyltransferase [Acidobacteria bacterium]|nr:GNAT family N-acetyltransferase [Acidobacteriota bacterium]
MISPFGWLQVRQFLAHDIEPLARLLVECFPNEDWRLSDVRRFLSPKYTNVVKIAANEQDSRLYGALLYTLETQQCRIRRVAITTSCRRHGIGSGLLKRLIGPRSIMRQTHFIARVRETNLTAQLLLRKLDFRAGDTSYRYEDTGEAGYLFSFIRSKRARTLTTSPGYA